MRMWNMKVEQIVKHGCSDSWVRQDSIEAPSDGNTTLDGSTYPRWKMFCFSWLYFFLAYENGTGYIRDQCCHLQGDGASLTAQKCWKWPSRFIEEDWSKYFSRGVDNTLINCSLIESTWKILEGSDCYKNLHKPDLPDQRVLNQIYLHPW